MRTRLLPHVVSALLLALSAQTALAMTLAGVSLHPAVQSHAGALVLASCGVKRSLAINHYVSAVYVPPTGSIHALNDANAAKAVRIHITNDKFLPGEVPPKWRNALARAVPTQTLQTLDSMMQGLRQGDLVAIAYTPKEGTTVSKNGEPVVRVMGHRAIDEVLRTWAKDVPIATKLDDLVAAKPCGTTTQRSAAASPG